MLPRLIVVADRFTQPDAAERTMQAALAGAPWILLRDREADEADLARAATELVAQLRAIRPSPLISITAAVTVAEALQLNLHLGSCDLSLADARRALDASTLIGYSAHDADEVQQTASMANYLFFSPVFETSHRPGVAPTGLNELQKAVEMARRTPVFALGGITPHRVSACFLAGAHGVAVRSGILEAPDVGRAVEAYLQALSPETHR